MTPPLYWPEPDAPLLVGAIHGILTEETDANWPDRFDAYVGMRAKMLVREYDAGPWPRINFFIKNPRYAIARANEIETHQRRRADEGKPPYRVGLVGHSNGSDIVVRTTNELAERGIYTETIILTGSVTHPNVRKSGVLALIERGALGRAFAYCSGSDVPLRIPLKWPYRDLGRRGWQDVPREFEDRIVTRWFPGFGHSGYFSRRHRNATFRQFCVDLGLGGSQ